MSRNSAREKHVTMDSAKVLYKQPCSCCKRPWTSSALADAVGVSKTAMWNWLNGG